MQRLHVLLLLRAWRHEAHRWLLQRDRNCLGVVVIVLLPFHEGLNKLRADDLGGMTGSFELTMPMIRATAGFNANSTKRELSDERQELCSPQPLR